VDKSIKRIYENYRTNFRLRPKLEMLLGEKFFRSPPKNTDQYKAKVEEIRAALGRGNAGTVAKGVAVMGATFMEKIPAKAFPSSMGPVDLSGFGDVMKMSVEDEQNDEVQDLFEEIDCEYNEWFQMALHSRVGAMFLKTAVAVNQMNKQCRVVPAPNTQHTSNVPPPPPEMVAKYEQEAATPKPAKKSKKSNA
jgi:hypothetical protein